MRLLKLCLILSFALTVSSCSRDSRDVSADKVKKETAEAYDALESYAIQKKEEFQQQAQAALDSYEKKIHELKAAAEKASG